MYINKSQLIIFNTNYPPDSQMIKCSMEMHKKSLCSITSILYKVRSFFPRRIMWKMYTLLVHSKIMYLINIYGSANKKIFISQKRAIKIAHDVHYRFDSVELFTQNATKTLPLLLLYEKSIRTLTHQYTMTTYITQ